MARGNFFYQRLGKRVCFERTKRELSQEQLSNLTEVDRTYIARIEKGRANPTLRILYKVAIGLSLRLDQLLQGV